MLPSHKLCAGGNKHLVIGLVTGAFSLPAFYHLNVPLHHLPPSFPHQVAEHNLQDIQWWLYTVSRVFLANRVLYFGKMCFICKFKSYFQRTLLFFQTNSISSFKFLDTCGRHFFKIQLFCSDYPPPPQIQPSLKQKLLHLLH